jgi:class 3 adenylate cyclase
VCEQVKRSVRRISAEFLTQEAAVHAGEIEVHDDGDICGLVVNLAARVEQHASPVELWVSSAIRDMMLGSSNSFADRGEHQLKGIEGDWKLFAVT